MAVVIGAGVGGLAVAARLAAAGHRVDVVERAATHGGKLGAFSRDGFTFDTGPSLLTLPQVFRDLFTDTGADLDTALDLRRVDPACHYRFADGTTLDVPHDADAVPGALDAALGPPAGEQWAALMAGAARLWDLVGEPVLRNPLGGVTDLVKRATNLRDLAAIAPWRTLHGLGRGLDDLRLRQFLDRYATYSGSDPRKLPAVMSVVPYVEQRFGAWHPAGGMRRLADALLQRCTDLGVRFHFGTEVVAVETDAAGVVGVRLADGERVADRTVVSDADAGNLYGHLVRDRRARGPLRALRSVRPSLAGFVLLLALRGRTEDPRHHRVLFPDDYDDEFRSIFGKHPRPVPDPTAYVCSPGDPGSAPPGCEGWFVLVNAPRHEPGSGVDWDRPGLADEYADLVLATLARRGLDVRDRLRWREVRTPADWERDTASPGGSIYGSSSNGPRAALLRPANRSPVPGLHLVGGSAHPGGGLPIVTLSAEITARLIGPA
ncbi:phytoene desaturase family protein [Actinokineospora bangkokensis]|uniref:Phytoene desaturase n=1 Tax=Actinokineospora bangkokensis TaxID=1193682 RepID=A0A1Q9LNV9_9PSEU|nr:phytoene desaturase family protein [Actinokineospora bangkokensis]OLR93689.1 phytoene desaturase [Actinokineospora bangkokensis]